MPSRPAPDRLQPYRERRDFNVSPEPHGRTPRRRKSEQIFVVQKHWASRLHYDFRLELDGVLISWALPKGPSFDPKEKRMAVHVEDHPIEYASFEGTIAPKHYGAGKVLVWDRGTWEPVGDAHEGLEAGKLIFRLHGEKLAGTWELVRIRKPADKQDPWILFKKRDEWARPLADYDVVTALPDSVIACPLGLLEQREPRAPSGFSAGPGIPADEEAALAAAAAVKLPTALSPQLATPSRVMPQGPGWVLEIKYDGYRLLSHIENGRVTLLTRAGHDWTAKMRSLKQAIAQLGLEATWLDGEIVVLDASGTPNFNLLQTAFDGRDTVDIVYFVFDAPYLEGRDIRGLPLATRRSLVQRRIEAATSDRVRFSAALPGEPASVLQAACALGMEGIIAKRADAPYVSARTETWLKLKSVQRQEFVVGGFVARRGGPAEVGALLLGVFAPDGRLAYSGSVGTGWDARTASALMKRLRALEVPDSPFDGVTDVLQRRGSPRSGDGERWARPELVVEVSFADWTADGSIRHAVFRGLRADKPAIEVLREPTLEVQAATTASNTLQISHPERVVDPSTGITKLQLVRYYESMSQWILPHLRGRPVSLVRAPSGIGGELFFQKHNDTLRIKGIREFDKKLWPGHAPLIEIDNVDALLGAAQMNVIEFHTWNATARHVNRPDRIVFDLDPGDGTSWQHVKDAAMLTRSFLQELGLESFLKTSGGKGLHVVVPLTPKDDWGTVKGFSQAVVEHMARAIPSRFVSKSGAANRVGKIYVDYLRNGRGQTTAAAFSARSRPGMGVSMPIAWDALAELKSGAQWTVTTAREHLSLLNVDPWQAYGSVEQTLAKGIAAMGPVRKR